MGKKKNNKEDGKFKNTPFDGRGDSNSLHQEERTHTYIHDKYNNALVVIICLSLSQK